ncbi:MAG: alpha/beta hydrolase [Clostridia bacterium]|nr:alpha/beta hydrolase [Clostridia bacterium]
MIVGIILLAVCAVLLWRGRKVISMVWDNMTVKHVTLPEEDSWQGGRTLKGIRYGEAESQWFDLYLPESTEPLPLMILLHGGGFVTNDARSRQAHFMYRYFRDHGFACASVNYRLAQEAPYPGAVDDVTQAISYLAMHASELGVDASRCAIWGESAGAYLACRAAFSAQAIPIRVLLDFYGPSGLGDARGDFKEAGIPGWLVRVSSGWITRHTQGYPGCEAFWLRRRKGEWTEADTLETSLVRRIQASNALQLSVWITHGEADITVPARQSIRMRDALVEALGSESVHLDLCPHLPHAADTFYADEALCRVEAFVRAHLWETEE